MEFTGRELYCIFNSLIVHRNRFAERSCDELATPEYRDYCLKQVKELNLLIRKVGNDHETRQALQCE